MTRRGPYVSRSPAAPRPRRWLLPVASLALLLAAGTYWLTSRPAPRADEPSSAATPRARAQQPFERGARSSRSTLPVTNSPRQAAPAEPEEPGAELAEATQAADEADLHDEVEAEPHGASTAPHTAAAPAPEAPEAMQESSAERPPRPKPRRRQLELTVLRRWTQPGLCARGEQATEAQRTLMRHFRASELATGARVFLDPRLPSGAEQPALGYLEEAQRVLQSELQLSPGPPDVFLYHDVQLLLASACTNADVVAYYDGALHIVVTRDDVRESVLHEFTHHALMSAGVIGPAWLQEGMAMHIARESWWRRPDLLQRLIERPFGLSTMETVVPYTLESEQAVLFYAQAAAMVECAMREPDSTLSGLLGEVDVQQAGETLDYGLPPLAEAAALRECLRELAQEPQPKQQQ